MSDVEAANPPEKPRKARRSKAIDPPMVLVDHPPRLTPTDHLRESHRDRIDALEAEKVRSNEAINKLQAKIDVLGPENARLLESLENADSNNTLALIFTVLGGGILELASYNTAPLNLWAMGGSGILTSGLIIMVYAKVRSWFRK